MNLTSCMECGVVLDKDQLNFPDEDYLEDDDGSIDNTKAEWNGSKYVSKVPCPVCQESILDI